MAKKGKDPAFLFYPGDWLGGTSDFTRHHKGAYMDLLMAQFNKGRLSLDDVKDILGADFDSMWDRKLKPKFIQDENGLFYNERLDLEKLKRSEFTSSRRKNLENKNDKEQLKPSDKANHTDQRMEDENVNVNEIKKENEIKKLKAEFDFKFVEEKFLPVLLDWLIYKKSKGQKYKNEDSLKILYENLLSLSNNDPDTARLVVKQAMGNNWAGLFPLSDKFKESNQLKQAKDF